MEPPNEWRVAPAHNMEHLQAIRKHQCTQEKKKEEGGGRKQEHSYRQCGEAAFLRGPHVNEQCRESWNKQGR